jgi:hypothetical protein
MPFPNYPALSSFWPWQPQSRYHILDLRAMERDRLVECDNVVALLFRLEQLHLPEEVAALINEVIGWFRRHPDHEALKRLFTELVHQTIVGLGAALPIPEGLTEMQTMMSRLPEIWTRQYQAEGRAEGRAEGEIRGEAKAFILLAEQRLGRCRRRCATASRTPMRPRSRIGSRTCWPQPA